MFGTFGESAMAAVGRAQEVALARSATEIDAADVILAVLPHLTEPADRSLTLLGAVLAAANDNRVPDRASAATGAVAGGPDPAQLRRLDESAPADRIPHQRIPFAESAIATFRGAWKKAKWDGRKTVDEYDLLTAAVEQPALARARSEAGIDLDQVRATITQMRQSAAE